MLAARNRLDAALPKGVVSVEKNRNDVGVE
jgi:hypothetical protein